MGNSKSRPIPATGAAEGEAVMEDNTERPEQAPPLNSALSSAEQARLEKQVSSALKQMKRYPKSPAVQRQKLGKLRQYVNTDHDKNSSHYLQLLLHGNTTTNGLTLVMTAMRLHGKHSPIQDHACRICTLLSRQDSAATISALPLVLTAMKTHKRNTNIQLNGLAALTFWGMDLKEGEPRVRSTAEDDNTRDLAVSVVTAGAYPVIFAAMKTFEANTLMQDKALKALVVLTSTDHHKDNRTNFVTGMAWRALQNCLTHPNCAPKPKLQVKGIKIMRAIATEFPGSVSKRLRQLVLPAMKQHLTDVSIQKHGCSLLLLLASSDHEPSHAILWQPGGGREAILAAMQHHTDQEDIQKTAILALQKLPARQQSSDETNTTTTTSTNTQTTTTTNTTHDKNETSDAISQGLEAMVASLVKPDTPPSTLTNICKALIRLASASHTNKLDIASANGVQAICTAMQSSVETASLQRYACQCLTQLAAVEATKRDIVQQAQAIPVIVKAMTTHTRPEEKKNDIKSQSSPSPHYLATFHAILLLVRLSQLLANHAKMIPSIPAIVHAMEVHHDRATLQHKAMVVLHKLAARFVKFKKPIIKAGALEAILNAMVEHADHTPIQRLGCQCLLNLHHHKTTSMWMVQAGVLQVVVATMQRHVTHIGIQLAALRVIAEMILCSSWHVEQWSRVNNTTTAGGGGGNGMQCLVLSIRMHLDNTTLQQLALGILQHSSKQFGRPHIQRQLVQAGGIGAVLDCLQNHHANHVRIQQAGFRTLKNLTSSRRNSVQYGAIILQNGGWKVIRQAKRVCVEDEFVQRYASTLLVKLVVMFLLHWFLWVAYHVAFVTVVV